VEAGDDDTMDGSTRRLPPGRALLAALLAVLGAALPAAAARPLLRLSPLPLRLAPHGANDCAGGIAYDDGSFENRYNLAGEAVVDLVQRFDLPAVPTPLRRLCVCFTRTGGDGAVDFDLLVYAGTGTGGQPGALLTGLGGLRAEQIPLFPQVAFYGVDLTALGIHIAQPTVYIGPSWDNSVAEEVFLCGDENGPAVRPVFFSTDQGGSWEDLGGVFPDLSAVGVRAEVGDGGGSFQCVPDTTTLCLNGGRFQARLRWRDNQGQLRDAKVVTFGSDDSGMFYFLDRDNWEMLVKVLDGCAINGHYWLFSAAVTNVEYTLTVTDSATGVAKVYPNAAGIAAPAVTDTRAFATCP
jgi:hypothetical protein